MVYNSFDIWDIFIWDILPANTAYVAAITVSFLGRQPDVQVVDGMTGLLTGP